MKRNIWILIIILMADFLCAQSGNVGIGTTTPTSQFVLGSDFNLHPDLTGDTYLTIGDNGSLDVSALIIGSSVGNFAKLSWQESVNELRFDLFKSGVPDIGILLLNDNGNVGIQNPNLEPSELLSVGDDFGSTLGGKRITIANKTGTSGLNIGEDIDNRGFLLWDSAANRLQLGTRSSATTYGQTLSVIDGRIGISNPNPGYHLHVGDGNMGSINKSNTRMVVSDNDNGERSALLALSKTSAGSTVEAQFEAYGGAGPGVIIGSSTEHPLYFRTGNLTRMTIIEDGKVGIGTIPSNFKLEVNGDAAKTGGGMWSAISDYRLKKNIRDYKDGLDELMNIRPVFFKYNELSGYNTEKEHIGVIAQELNKIAPYMIGSFEKEGNEYLKVDPSAMIYMMVNAIKEQQKEIVDLKKQIDNKDSAFKQLSDKVEILILQMRNLEASNNQVTDM